MNTDAVSAAPRAAIVMRMRLRRRNAALGMRTGL